MSDRYLFLRLAVASLITASVINLFPSPASPQTADGCYMENVNGQLIDLSRLCGGGGSSPANVNRNPGRSPGNPNHFQVKIKRRYGGIPVIDVLFNGKKTYEMLIDTGASGTVLTVAMAEELKLTPENYVLVETPSSSAMPFRTTTVDSIQIGGAILKNLEVAVSPTLAIGLLGQDFFQDFDITIKEKIIEFKRR